MIGRTMYSSKLARSLAGGLAGQSVGRSVGLLRPGRSSCERASGIRQASLLASGILTGVEFRNLRVFSSRTDSESLTTYDRLELGLHDDDDDDDDDETRLLRSPSENFHAENMQREQR